MKANECPMADETTGRRIYSRHQTHNAPTSKKQKATEIICHAK